jgi:hypothetical protein
MHRAAVPLPRLSQTRLLVVQRARSQVPQMNELPQTVYLMKDGTYLDAREKITAFEKNGIVGVYALKDRIDLTTKSGEKKA